MGRCKAKSKASNFKKQCRTAAMIGDDFCIYHSKSKRAVEFRRLPKKRKTFNRRKLLIELTEVYEEVKKSKGNALVKARLLAQLGSQIGDLISQLDKISELEKLVDEHLK